MRKVKILITFDENNGFCPDRDWFANAVWDKITSKTGSIGETGRLFKQHNIKVEEVE